MRVYTIADTLAGVAFPTVLCFANDASAVRFFRDIVKNRDTDVGKHPMDYQLVFAGELMDTGAILPAYGGSEVVVTGAAILAMDVSAPEGVNA